MNRQWIARLMVLAVFAMPVAHAAKECKPELLADLDLYISPAGAVFVPATVNGHEVYFLLDFGTGLAMVLESQLSTLGLRPILGGDVSAKWDGKQVTHFAKLDDLVVGTFRMASRNAPVLPNDRQMFPETVNGKPFVGFMGSTLIRNVDSEFFLAEHKLRLFKPSVCLGVAPVYWGGDVAALPLHWDAAATLVFIMELNGKRVEASLSSQSSESTVDAEAASKFFGIDTGADGGGQVFHPMSLTSAGMQVRDAPVRVRYPSACEVTKSTPAYGAIGYSRCVGRAPFAIGSNLLSQLRIYIAVKRETIFVSRVGAPADPSKGAVSVAPAE
jgi:hypothetical protein